MRSRDGTQTLCVVCEPKVATAVSVPQTVSEPASAPSAPLTGTAEQFYCAVAAGILKSLDSALQVEPSFETAQFFVSTIQSALPALQKCAPISASDAAFAGVLDKLRRQIISLLDTLGAKSLSARFEWIDQLLKELKQLEDLLK